MVLRNAIHSQKTSRVKHTGIFQPESILPSMEANRLDPKGYTHYAGNMLSSPRATAGENQTRQKVSLGVRGSGVSNVLTPKYGA